MRPLWGRILLATSACTGALWVLILHSQRSRTLIQLLFKLGATLNFDHICQVDRGYNHSRHYGERKEVDKFVDKVLRKRSESGGRGHLLAYTEHVHFVDFTATDNYRSPRNPIYINYLREPMSRFQSRFNFGRQDSMLHFYFHGLYRDGEPGAVEGYANETDWARKDINDCIADLDDRECNFRDGDLVDNSISYFCGHDDYCPRYGNHRALTQAKANLERHYTVVGIFERRKESDKMLEHLIPQFFRGLSTFGSVTANVGQLPKAPLTPESEQRLRRTLEAEMDLYRFAVQRFERQLEVARRESDAFSTK